MPAITVRDVPEEVRDALAARARRSGTTLQAYLRSHLIALSSRPDPSELAARINARKAVTGSRISPEQTLDYRDHDRS